MPQGKMCIVRQIISYISAAALLLFDRATSDILRLDSHPTKPSQSSTLLLQFTFRSSFSRCSKDMAQCNTANTANQEAFVTGVKRTAIPCGPQQEHPGNRIEHAVQYQQRLQSTAANVVTQNDRAGRHPTPRKQHSALNPRLQKNLLDVINRLQGHRGRFAQGTINSVGNSPEIAGVPSTLRAQHTTMLHQHLQLNRLIMASQARRNLLKDENAVLRQKNAAYSKWTDIGRQATRWITWMNVYLPRFPEFQSVLNYEHQQQWRDGTPGTKIWCFRYMMTIMTEINFIIWLTNDMIYS